MTVLFEEALFNFSSCMPYWNLSHYPAYMATFSENPRGLNAMRVLEGKSDLTLDSSITAGGQSGDPKSPHFADQIAGFSSGNFRDIYYYDADIKANAEETYKPGRRASVKK